MVGTIMDEGGNRSGQERRERILMQAAEVFFRKGFHGSSVDEVARAVGLLKGSLYYHIRSKEDLLVELLCRTLEEAQQAVARQAAADADPRQRLERMLEAHVDFVLREPVRVGVLLNEYDRLRGPRRQKVEQMWRDYERQFVRAVREAQQAGQVMDGPAELIAQSLLGLGSWAARLAGAGGRSRPRQLRQTLLRMMLHGIAA
jgi:AcrR family transcriptional regulator